MINSILIVLAFSLDTFSFGISSGADKNFISLFQIVYFSILSYPLFLIPILLSKSLSTVLNEKVCFLINGLVLLFISFYYFGKFIRNKMVKNRQNLALKGEIDKNDDKNLTEKVKMTPAPHKLLFINLIPMNLDAMFSNFFIGFTFRSVFIVSVCFISFTFMALYFGNRLASFISAHVKVDFSFVSALLFLILAIEKMI